MNVCSQQRSGQGALEASAASVAYRWYVVALLSAIYALSSIDRQLPFVLAESIKRELHLSDTQLGLVGGLAFSVFYTGFAIPMAVAADRLSRKWVICSAVTLWSAMTALSGSAQSFIQLCSARAGVGIGEAGCTAPAHSLIASYFPARRATALSVFSVGATVGTTAGFWLGGHLADWFGWRSTFFVFGAPGLLLGLLAAVTIREARIDGAHLPATSNPGMIATVLELAGSRTYRNTALAAALHAFSCVGFSAWLSPFLMRTHQFTVAEAGMSVGLLAGVLGSVGVVGGGFVSDHLARYDRRWQLWLPACSIVGAASLCVAAVSVSSAGVAIALLAPAMLLSTVYAGPCFAMIQDLARPSARATASAFTVLMMSLIGSGVGPAAIGLVSDLLHPVVGDQSLQAAMCVIVVSGDVAAVTLILLALRTASSNLPGLQVEGSPAAK